VATILLFSKIKMQALSRDFQARIQELLRTGKSPAYRLVTKHVKMLPGHIQVIV